MEVSKTMNKKIIALLLALCAVMGCFAGCGNETIATNPATTAPTATDPNATEPNGTEPNETQPFIDYAGQVVLDIGSSQTVKYQVAGKPKSYIDGDTTHFYVPNTISPTGVLKARYLGVNTPESTGKIEPWGKTASNYTKSKLESAQEIWLESDNDTWNKDSTGERFLVWVWYKPAGSDTYRNLNIELVQEGLSLASSGGSTRYGQQVLAATMQAEQHKKYIYSDEKDPDFWYDGAIPITLISLCTNLDLYKDKKVVFEGTISYDINQNVYIQDYDPETDMYYGMTVYYGYGLQGTGLRILSPGNRVRIVGVVQYSEGWGWQVSDIFYDEFFPDDPDCIQLIEKDVEVVYSEVTAADFKKDVTVEVFTEFGSDATELRTYKYGDLAISSAVAMNGLVVERYTVNTNETDMKGALTLYCRDADSNQFQIYTANVLRDENGAPISGDVFKGKTINVKGIVSSHYGTYQISVFSLDDITIQ